MNIPATADAWNQYQADVATKEEFLARKDVIRTPSYTANGTHYLDTKYNGVNQAVLHMVVHSTSYFRIEFYSVDGVRLGGTSEGSYVPIYTPQTLEVLAPLDAGRLGSLVISKMNEHSSVTCSVSYRRAQYPIEKGMRLKLWNLDFSAFEVSTPENPIVLLDDEEMLSHVGGVFE